MTETVNHPEDLNPAASYFRKGKLLKEINDLVLSFFHIHHGCTMKSDTFLIAPIVPHTTSMSRSKLPLNYIRMALSHNI